MQTRCSHYQGQQQQQTKPLPDLEEMDNLISSHFYFKNAPPRTPMKEIRAHSNNRMGTTTRNYYDLIVEDDNQLLMNEYVNKRDFRQIPPKFWNLKERITFIQEEVQAMLD